MTGAVRIWTIGHSTHPIEDFITLLKNQGIEMVADVRSVPKSRHVPQFNREELARNLGSAGIDYLHMEALGGWRKPVPGSQNIGWRSPAFRGYADYMQTDEFVGAAAELMKLAEEKPTVVMCAEGLPFRCHRSIIADYLTAKEVEVMHIYPDGKVKPHTLTSFAVIKDGSVVYPSEGSEVEG